MTTLLLLAMALAADPTKPHPHKGLVPPFNGAPPAVSLTTDETARLTAGKPVLKQVQTAKGGRGVAIFDVKAPPEKVFGVVTNYAMYPSWVDNVSRTSVYKRDGNNVYVDFTLDPMGMTVQYFVKHLFDPKAGLITWTLDYSRASDLDDSVGYWRITPVSATPPVTRVEYSVSIAISGWVPGFIKSLIEEKGLQNATSWVKVQSER